MDLLLAFLAGFTFWYSNAGCLAPPRCHPDKRSAGERVIVRLHVQARHQILLLNILRRPPEDDLATQASGEFASASNAEHF